ncbi:hypothetical protein H9P43_000672 [Blastocladiella emersonii ATCC 22665]|nr:hypothetical protein H9P43_000672 [Blastocladiella emersonii ATCC 22665]
MQSFLEQWYHDETATVAPCVAPLPAQRLRAPPLIPEALSEPECEWLFTQICPPNTPYHSVTISYDRFAELRAALPAKFKPYLSPAVFLRLPKDMSGALLGLPWMHYILKKGAVYEARSGLCAASKNGVSLTHDEFAAFILARYARDPADQPDDDDDDGDEDDDNSEVNSPLSSPPLSRYSSEVRLAGPARAVPAALADVAAEYLIQALAPAVPAWPVPLRALLGHPVVLEIAEHAGFFARRAANGLFDQYCALLGTPPPRPPSPLPALSRTAAGRMCNGVLTETFLSALQRPGPVTWRRYAAFMVAASDVHRVPAMRALFRTLDVDGAGVLTEHAVREYVRDVCRAVSRLGLGPEFSVEDVVNEVFDMARCTKASGIALKDLLACGVGGTVIRILVDVHGLAQYDAFLSSGSGGGGGGGAAP